jgi:NAD(P)-dependent dehydrogenase (short-subunit alcohol dehydrogenase family)
MTRLTNKIALIVGGQGGIGGAVSQRFAEEGAQVYATSRKGTNGVSEATSPGSIRAIRADASNIVDLNRVFDQIRSEQGRIDIVVINAGISKYAPLEDISEDHFDRTFGLNVRSLVFAVQGATDQMQPGGTIVLIGSIAATSVPKDMASTVPQRLLSAPSPAPGPPNLLQKASVSTS